jgi:methylated-DNA-[protein]-cysteine S-methyltransferase
MWEHRADLAATLAIFGHHGGVVVLSENGEQPAVAVARLGSQRSTHDVQEDVMPYVSKQVRSPVGLLTLVASERGLAAILWPDDRPGRVRLDAVGEAPDHPVLGEAERQLAEYFAGRRTEFDLPLDPAGTPFQQKVWNALRSIPFGETRTYAEVASQIGHPGAARAVGAASGRNPLSIVAPCHRVVGTSGELTGFAGGLEVKARLLAFERAG